VLIGEIRSNFFFFLSGLRQGCVLSPLLFSLFINYLVLEIEKLEAGVRLGSLSLSILLFADDIVLVADNKRDMQRMLDRLSMYSRQMEIRF